MNGTGDEGITAMIAAFGGATGQPWGIVVEVYLFRVSLEAAAARREHEPHKCSGGSDRTIGSVDEFDSRMSALVAAGIGGAAAGEEGMSLSSLAHVIGGCIREQPAHLVWSAADPVISGEELFTFVFS